MDASLNELIRLLDLVPPTPADAAASTRPTADRPASLEGATVALLDNSKDNAALLLGACAELLEESFGIGSTSFFSKPLHTRIADESQLQAAAQSDCAVVAIGD